MKVFFDFIVGLEEERVYEMGVLWALEDDVGEMGEEGVEAGLHAPDHLYFPG